MLRFCKYTFYEWYDKCSLLTLGVETSQFFIFYSQTHKIEILIKTFFKKQK